MDVAHVLDEHLRSAFDHIDEILAVLQLDPNGKAAKSARRTYQLLDEAITEVER